MLHLPPLLCHTGDVMRAALYARVSTERQGRDQTIDSQLTALQAWAAVNGHVVGEDHIYRDEGLSGSRLDRPGLDRLRDAARDGAVEVIGVLSPDRLARKYAYQVLLLEEFRRVGCTVVFLHHPISDDPNDQLLLQIQGAMPNTSAPSWPNASVVASCRGHAPVRSSLAAHPMDTVISAVRRGSWVISSLTKLRPTWFE